MRATLGSLVVAVVAVFVLAAFTRGDDPCAGHVTPDGVTADAMGPCDEMPGVP